MGARALRGLRAWPVQDCIKTKIHVTIYIYIYITAARVQRALTIYITAARVLERRALTIL